MLCRPNAATYSRLRWNRRDACRLLGRQGGRIRVPARHLLIWAAALLLIAGCAGKQEKKPPPRAIRVGVLPVDRGEIRHWVKASGPLKFIANTIVSSEVSAQIKSILVTDGQAVSVGEVLLVFDDTKIRENANQAGSNLQKDQATLAYRKIDWEKNRKLYESGTISHTAYEQKLSEYQETAAQVEADRAMLAKAMNDLNRVFVAGEDEKAHLRTIRLGTVNDTYAEVVEGLNEGEAVISRGKDVIGDGQPLNVGKMMQP